MSSHYLPLLISYPELTKGILECDFELGTLSRLIEMAAGLLVVSELDLSARSISLDTESEARSIHNCPVLYARTICIDFEARFIYPCTFDAHVANRCIYRQLQFTLQLINTYRIISENSVLNVIVFDGGLYVLEMVNVCRHVGVPIKNEFPFRLQQLTQRNGETKHADALKTTGSFKLMVLLYCYLFESNRKERNMKCFLPQNTFRVLCRSKHSFAVELANSTKLKKTRVYESTYFKCCMNSVSNDSSEPKYV